MIRSPLDSLLASCCFAKASWVVSCLSASTTVTLPLAVGAVHVRLWFTRTFWYVRQCVLLLMAYAAHRSLFLFHGC